jgi:hypothetical protein
MEHKLQCECVLHLQKFIPQCHFNANRGESPTIQSRVKNKQAGYVAGSPDLMIYNPSANGKYHGLAIEFKVNGNKLSDKQVGEFIKLQSHPWQTAVIRDKQTFIEIVEDHLGL